MFELLLRLRANYLWPAMWGNAFNEDDPENPRLADEYGIVMGTSKTWNINDQLTWKNNYTKMYPAGAARMIETVTLLELPESADNTYILSIQPLDPVIAIYKVIIDLGGYEQTHLKMNESPYEKY